MEEIDLKELFKVFWEKKFYIVLTVIVFAVFGVIYSTKIKTPVYSSAATLVLVQSQGGNDSTSSITASDITLNSKLVSTYSEIIKSNTTIRDVISNLGLEMNESDIRKNIKVTAVEDTEVIKITVSNVDAELASRIANETANVFIQKAKSIYKIDNVQVLDQAETSTKPSNINHVKTIVIFMSIGLVISCGYVFLQNMFDNTVKSANDIEKAIKVPVLASIPTNRSRVGKGGTN